MTHSESATSQSSRGRYNSVDGNHPLIQFKPPTNINFVAVEEKGFCGSLILKNISSPSAFVAYKIKTNVGNKYKVRHSSGMIEPKKKATVNFLLPEDDTVAAGDKLLIRTGIITRNMTRTEVDEFFRTTKQQVYKTRIPINVEIRESQSVSQGPTAKSARGSRSKSKQRSKQRRGSRTSTGGKRDDSSERGKRKSRGHSKPGHEISGDEEKSDKDGRPVREGGAGGDRMDSDVSKHGQKANDVEIGEKRRKKRPSSQDAKSDKEETDKQPETAMQPDGTSRPSQVQEKIAVEDTLLGTLESQAEDTTAHQVKFQVKPEETILMKPYLNAAEGLRNYIQLKNIGKHPSAFRIKVSTIGKYKYRPSSGLLEGGEKQEVLIMLPSDKQILPEDKFMIQAVLVEGTSTKQDLDKAFKSAKSKYKKTLHVAMGDRPSGTHVALETDVLHVTEKHLNEKTQFKPLGGKSLLKIYPAGKIQFYRSSQEEEATAELNLENMNDSSIAFKIKSRDPAHFSISPHHTGTLTPDENTMLRITLAGNTEEYIANQNSFQVIAMVCNDTVKIDQIAELWQTVPSNALESQLVQVELHTEQKQDAHHKKHSYGNIQQPEIMTEAKAAIESAPEIQESEMEKLEQKQDAPHKKLSYGNIQQPEIMTEAKAVIESAPEIQESEMEKLVNTEIKKNNNLPSNALESQLVQAQLHTEQKHNAPHKKLSYGNIQQPEIMTEAKAAIESAPEIQESEMQKLVNTAIRKNNNLPPDKRSIEYIKFDPPKEIHFLMPDTDESTRRYVQLKNISEANISFRTKSSHPDNFTATPIMATIRPGEMIEVIVKAHRMPEMIPNMVHTLTILYTPIANGDTLDENKIWQTLMSASFLRLNVLTCMFKRALRNSNVANPEKFDNIPVEAAPEAHLSVNVLEGRFLQFYPAEIQMKSSGGGGMDNWLRMTNKGSMSVAYKIVTDIMAFDVSDTNEIIEAGESIVVNFAPKASIMAHNQEVNSISVESAQIDEFPKQGLDAFFRQLNRDDVAMETVPCIWPKHPTMMTTNAELKTKSIFHKPSLLEQQRSVSQSQSYMDESRTTIDISQKETSRPVNSIAAPEVTAQRSKSQPQTTKQSEDVWMAEPLRQSKSVHVATNRNMADSRQSVTHEVPAVMGETASTEKPEPLTAPTKTELPIRTTIITNRNPSVEVSVDITTDHTINAAQISPGRNAPTENNLAYSISISAIKPTKPVMGLSQPKTTSHASVVQVPLAQPQEPTLELFGSSNPSPFTHRSEIEIIFPAPISSTEGSMAINTEHEMSLQPDKVPENRELDTAREALHSSLPVKSTVQDDRQELPYGQKRKTDSTISQDKITANLRKHTNSVPHYEQPSTSTRKTTEHRTSLDQDTTSPRRNSESIKYHEQTTVSSRKNTVNKINNDNTTPTRNSMTVNPMHGRHVDILSGGQLVFRGASHQNYEAAFLVLQNHTEFMVAYMIRVTNMDSYGLKRHTGQLTANERREVEIRRSLPMNQNDKVLLQTIRLRPTYTGNMHSVWCAMPTDLIDCQVIDIANTLS